MKTSIVVDAGKGFKEILKELTKVKPYLNES
jgi:hypothetical protein